MVSLNEKRSKIRYVVQNKTEWTEDGNKFGQKMLEKMGWKQGNGLGKNQHGTKEHVDVKLKSNLKGLGFIRGKFDSTWIEHSNSFDSVLQQLQLSHSTSTRKNLSNFQENVQQTKTRFNYKKQSSGKDLSCRSQHELDCLFGSEIQKKQIQEKDDNDNDEETNDESNSNSTEDQLYTTSKKSIDEYFKEKYRSKLIKANQSQTNSNEKEKEKEKDKKRKSPSSDEEKEEEKVESVKRDEIYVGSNLSELNGYDGWKINSSIDELKRNKDKSRKKSKKSS